MARRPKPKMDIDVVPYLSIMVIVLKLICLILIVMIMPIALNPDALKILSFRDLFQAERDPSHAKMPVYFDCSREGVHVVPGDLRLTAQELLVEGNALDREIARIEQERDKHYVILVVRPKSLAVYRYLRKTLAQRDIEVGYDVLDEKTQINWAEEASLLNIKM